MYNWYIINITQTIVGILYTMLAYFELCEAIKIYDNIQDIIIEPITIINNNYKILLIIFGQTQLILIISLILI
jgi:hypothetical protein